MRHARTFMLGGAVVVAVVAAAWSLGTARADDVANMEPSKYQYVGLNNNLARIDPESGRVWVLKVAAGVDRRAGVNDIVTYPEHPWMWTEVRIMGVRGQSADRNDDRDDDDSSHDMP